MPTAFVTGGSGFVGRALIERLRRDGWDVRALARSDASASAVEALGATPVRGDLGDLDALRAGADGADVCFHAAAKVEDWGPRDAFETINVYGTKNALAACRDHSVRRFVHVGTEAAVLAGDPLVDADETEPLRPDSLNLYASTKAKAELLVRDANGPELETIVVRPRFVWGRGDTTLVPAMSEMVSAGQWRWIGGGAHRTSTTNIDNCVEGLVLAADRGTPGAAYFITDGEPVQFKAFVTDLLATRGVIPPDKSIPFPVALTAAKAAETVWKVTRRDGAPPVTRFAVWVAGLECTLDDSRARADLGYAPVTSIPEGLAALRAEHAAPAA